MLGFLHQTTNIGNQTSGRKQVQQIYGIPDDLTGLSPTSGAGFIRFKPPDCKPGTALAFHGRHA
jgi:hypothetical protein